MPILASIATAVAVLTLGKVETAGSQEGDVNPALRFEQEENGAGENPLPFCGFESALVGVAAARSLV